ncbi:hypothetical protein M419DRAFT_7353 [Trichoderma reesei RUT C-30]|uniref:CENP-V/GFA domain-containing protein n=1 Tax=Hypocrea jecorina (strain ATCC 56765 / BCRC 32924 / NRRL 11460 / Rut C-30) TaxID=1344414 RepID=A0A024SDP9_HYPJR|nr:hypothetical protein M419DRAFT_7353 [Trichoderma reesei RUT C-30]
MASSDDTPKNITGGCVCASVRYTVTFPPDHDFANSSTTCQCQQCRKNTGSLIFRSHKVPKSAVAFTARSTLGLYSATPHCERGFCSRCGSFLFWQRDDRDYTCLTVGCFDAPVLARYGPLLTAARRHLFCEREVPGVTDHLVGEKFTGDDE